MNLRNNNVELKKIKKPGCRGITQRDSAQVKLRNPQLKNMLLRPTRQRVQITKKSKRMNNSKRRAEFLYWGQGIKRGWGGQQDPRPGYLSVPLGRWWVHRHILLIYYLHFDVYAYFITQERSKWGRQEANAMGQRAARGRGEGQGMGCRLVLRATKVPPNQLMGIHPQSAQFCLEAHPADRLCV